MLWPHGMDHRLSWTNSNFNKSRPYRCLVSTRSFNHNINYIRNLLLEYHNKEAMLNNKEAMLNNKEAMLNNKEAMLINKEAMLK